MALLDDYATAGPDGPAEPSRPEGEYARPVALAALGAAIEGLSLCEELARGESGAVEDLFGQLDRLELHACRAAAAFDASGSWVLDGARSAGAWLARRCRLPRPLATRRVRIGRALRRFEVVASSWASGAIGAAAAKLILELERPSNKEALARDEALLVEQAGELGVEDLQRACGYWSLLADDAASKDKDLARLAERDVRLSKSLGGMWLGSITLDPISGEIVSEELARLEDELFKADCAAAHEALGREPKIEELARSAAQRRADALVEMATRSKAVLPGARRPEPLFSVLVDFPSFGRICELASGSVLTPAALVPYLTAAHIERAVFGLPNRVEVSARARFFTGATRRAIELRDRRCTHPYCDLPASRCQVDHIVPYTDGGETTQENGRLLCGAHNRARVRGRPRRRPPSDEELLASEEAPEPGLAWRPDDLPEPDEEGLDPDGFDPDGFDPDGFDPDGFDPVDVDPDDFDPDDFDPDDVDDMDAPDADGRRQS